MVPQAVVHLADALQLHECQRKGIANGQHGRDARAGGEAQGAGFFNDAHVEHDV